MGEVKQQQLKTNIVVVINLISEVHSHLVRVCLCVCV